MLPDEENFRSQWAISQLEQANKITMDDLIGIGYSHYLPAFDTLLPPLFAAYNALDKKRSISQRSQGTR